MNSVQLQILPLCLIMVMGPQILTAIFLVTSRETVRNSVAMLVGVVLAASLGLMLWYLVGDAVSVPEKAPGEGPSRTDYVVASLLVLLGLHVFRGRQTAEAPKWMTSLQQAEPKRAFALGFLLIFLMPTDIVAMVSTAAHLHEAGMDAVDGWPLVAGTVLLMALPLLAYLALGHRAREAMPGIRSWLTANAWLVNLVVIAYFTFQLLR